MKRRARRATRPRRGPARPRRGASGSARGRRASWARRVELATLASQPGDPVAAAAVFARLSPREQVALVREIADTRAAELTRAYADVVAVAYGLRRRRRQGVPQVERTPCVKVLIKRKREKKVVDPRHLVPEHLFAYVTLDGRRQLCAVPTDVEDAHDHNRARPHAPRRVLASPRDTTGVLTCAITRSPGTAPHVISCRHVLGFPDGSRAEVTIFAGDGTPVASPEPVAGVMDEAAEISLDGQIARVGDPALARIALGHTVDQAMGDPDDVLLVEQVFIMTPARTIPARVNAIRRRREHPISYPAWGSICHETLLELAPDLPTRPGDSGSPVLTESNGGLLVGMLIAGPPLTTPDGPGSLSYAIPAAHLLDATRYVGANGERWTLVAL